MIANCDNSSATCKNVWRHAETCNRGENRDENQFPRWRFLSRVGIFYLQAVDSNRRETVMKICRFLRHYLPTLYERT